MIGQRAPGGASVMTPDVPIEVLLDALRHFEQRLREIAGRALSGVSDVASQGAGAWRSAAALTTVSSATFLSPAARLAVADDVRLSRALAMRALYARGAQVRRCVDRDRLVTLRNAVGHEAFTRLLAIAPVHGAVEPAWPVDLTAQTLIVDGLSRLCHPGGIDDPSLLRLLSWRLDGAGPLPSGTLDADTELARETARFFTDLPSLLPEFV
ncbi:type III secretion protein HrpB4 [Pandoraea sp. ISTKB]|uniref:type III secretion protein HrpB4 n=1 Tax=Pandoraea sp. ISTKB TaxID=1586708 RepID=UPI000847A861|nr:type III secretion protein HrpB4 [Pandoraea sp. ISTKB]ODP34721.1 hypothetical protein A9762_14010 [Pandoraea sp. ISTKB]